MANKIQVKRGVEANLPQLDVGEPAFTTDSKKPFMGAGTENIELATKAQINSLDAESVKVNRFILSTDNGDYALAINRAIGISNGRTVVIADNETHIVNSPILLNSNSILVGSGSTLLKKGSTFVGDAIIKLDGCTNWSLQNFVIDGVDKSIDGIKSSSLDNIKYKLENVKVYNCKIGGEIKGYIGSFDAGCRFNFNDIGLQLTQNVNGVKINCLIEQNRVGAIVSEGSNVTFGSSCVIEGNIGGGLVIDNVVGLQLHNVYFEDNKKFHCKIGTTTLCKHIEISLCTMTWNCIDGGIIFDKAEYIKLSNNHITTTRNPIVTTSNTKYISSENSDLENGYLLGIGNQFKKPQNIFPNPSFEHWDSAIPMGIKERTGNGGIVSFAKETTMIKSGKNAIKIESLGSFASAYRGIKLKDETFVKLVGKNVSIGVWIYIPDIPRYASETSDGVYLSVLTDVGYISSSLTNRWKKGVWNFINISGLVQSNATWLEIRFFLNASTPVSIGDYIIIDDLVVAEGIYPADVLSNSINFSENNILAQDMIFDNGKIGIVCIDRTTGTKYRVFVNNGALSVEQV